MTRQTTRHDRATPLASVLVGVLTAVVLSAPGAPAHAAASRGSQGAANPATPGNFTGYGFDQCVAPSQKAMNRWLQSSPFLAVGIYISGDSRGCRNQPNLTPAWVRTQLDKGWRLLPITLGPQASCQPRFPRYGDDKTIKKKPGKKHRYPRARKQGAKEAAKTVAAARSLGLTAGSTLWYDLEGFDSSRTKCRESALNFLSAWTRKLHDLNYVSGVYSSAGSGIAMLDDARVSRPSSFTLPDAIWVARWDGVANTSTSYIREDGWRPGRRVKQYRGGHDETWGRVRINIDRNFLDLGKGSIAAPEDHCHGTDVDLPAYKRLVPKSRGKVSDPVAVTALQCLLKEKGSYSGRLTGKYNDKLAAAARAWRGRMGLSARDAWSRRAWVGLLAKGPHPVVKYGSTGPAVRRLQRALNAARKAHLDVDGVFDNATANALRTWQSRNHLEVSAVAGKKSWPELFKGNR